MNGYNEIVAEPADDEDLAIAYGFEIIYEDELDDMFTLSYIRRNPKSSLSSIHHRGNGKLPPNKSISSFASAPSFGVPSMPKPMSSCSLSSHVSEMSDGEYFSSTESGEADDIIMGGDDEHNGLQMSVENMWYIIQQKRHHDEEEEMKTSHHHHFMTMEHASNHNRLTEWFANLIHLPEKIRQQAAEKRRFNINKIPQEIREELKQLYVY